MRFFFVTEGAKGQQEKYYIVIVRGMEAAEILPGISKNKSVGRWATSS